MERLTERNPSWIDDEMWERACEPDCEEIDAVYRKLKDYEDAEEQGRYIKLPEKVEETEYRECVHTRTKCHHENCKCSECPLTELFCDEFYTAMDRCYEDAYARGCLAGIELGKAEAVQNVIDAEPTAYDPDKVVEQLEKLKSLVPVNRVLDDIVNDKPKELGMLIAYEKAIKIVKGGGVDG